MLSPHEGRLTAEQLDWLVRCVDLVCPLSLEAENFAYSVGKEKALCLQEAWECLCVFGQAGIIAVLTKDYEALSLAVKLAKNHYSIWGLPAGAVWREGKNPIPLEESVDLKKAIEKWPLAGLIQIGERKYQEYLEILSVLEIMSDGITPVNS